MAALLVRRKQGHRIVGSEVAAAEGEAGDRVGLLVAEIDEAGRDHVVGAARQRRHPGDGAGGKLDDQERISLGKRDDPLGSLRLPAHRRNSCSERGRLLRLQRPEIELREPPRAAQSFRRPAQLRGGGLRPVGERGDHAGSRIAGIHHRADVCQRPDRGGVGEVGVVDDDHHGGAGRGGKQKAPEGADHAMPRQPGGRLRRVATGEWRQARERGERRLPDLPGELGTTLEQRLGNRRQGRIGAAALARRDDHDEPAFVAGEPSEVPEQRRLADPGRAADRQQLRRLAGAQQHRQLRELEVATDDRRRVGAEIGDGLLVECARLLAWNDPQLVSQGCPESAEPADGGRPLAGVELPAHQLDVGALVRGVELDQPLPVAGGAQQ